MNLKDKLNPTHTALIVIDIQNDFCAPSGVMAKMGKDVSGMDEVVAGIKKLAEVCEAVNIPVLYTQQVYDRSKLTPLQKEQYDLDGKLVTCDIAGDGWKLYGLNPPNGKVYQKYNYNAFSNHKFADDLKAFGSKTLIITGVSTQICVETAVRAGFDIGYKVVVPANLVATTSKDPSTKERTLNLIRKTYGVVTDSTEIISLLQT